MTTTLTIVHEQFPTVPDAIAVGDKITLMVTGIVRRIEADNVDITSMGGPPDVIHGQHEIEPTVTGLGLLP